MPRQRQLSERVITETSVISNHNTSIAEVSFVDNEIFRNGGYMEETRTELQMIKMSEIQSKEVAWLWYPFIPYGKLTIIQGDPGDGKTTLVLNIAAKLSKGEGLDSDMKLTEPLAVIYQSAEDGLADTVKPRLEAAGADCENISVIDESKKSLSMTDERLEEAIYKDKSKTSDFRPDTSLSWRQYGYEPCKRSKGHDKETCGSGRKISMCHCACRTHEQGGRE